ncbi:6-phosphogluconolactonase [Chlorobium sp. N1]|uniref:6-phosphogluconolactonase n=1 Tax=Chlorobium sp. N1 TaxID=2491138 RepID=UPI001038BD5B|nr:6-phosphogluconolactonase [Chlorobium sp. N1]TCD47882.1 6-phosphogluconolactonase [Chlorobium sp. N1]
MTPAPRTNSPEHFTGTPEELAEQAAALIILEAHRSVRRHGFFSMALSGGSSPRPLYRLLRQGLEREAFGHSGLPLPEAEPDAEGAFAMPWRNSLFFFGDERCVPPESLESNYRMARETLFSGMEEKGMQIFRMEGEDRVPEEAAKRYEALLLNSPIGTERKPEDRFPALDLVLLGLGPDGHTASLFPGDRKALQERERRVVATGVPPLEPRVRRLSLSMPVLNHARTVLFFSPSPEKAALAASIILGKRPDLPASMVRPEHGRTIWLTAPQP